MPVGCHFPRIYIKQPHRNGFKTCFWDIATYKTLFVYVSISLIYYYLFLSNSLDGAGGWNHNSLWHSVMGLNNMCFFVNHQPSLRYMGGVKDIIIKNMHIFVEKYFWVFEHPPPPHLCMVVWILHERGIPLGGTPSDNWWVVSSKKSVQK